MKIPGSRDSRDPVRAWLRHSEHIATGETSCAIALSHFLNYFHFFDYFHYFILLLNHQANLSEKKQKINTFSVAYSMFMSCCPISKWCWLITCTGVPRPISSKQQQVWMSLINQLQVLFSVRSIIVLFLCSIARSSRYGPQLLKYVCPRLSRSPRKGKTWDPLNVAGGKKQTVFLSTKVGTFLKWKRWYFLGCRACTVGDTLSPVSGAHLSLASVTLFKIQLTNREVNFKWNEIMALCALNMPLFEF